MRSQMFYKIDLIKISVNFIGKRLYKNLWTPAQMFFWEFFEIFRNIFITEHLQTAAFDFNSIFLLF